MNRAILLQILDQPLSAYWRLVQDPCAFNELEVTHSHARAKRARETRELAGLGEKAVIDNDFMEWN